METGIVKWFNETKGYGFITPDRGSQDIFFHMTSLEGAKTVKTGQKVSFRITTNKGKKAADNVKLA